MPTSVHIPSNCQENDGKHDLPARGMGEHTFRCAVSLVLLSQGKLVDSNIFVHFLFHRELIWAIHFVTTLAYSSENQTSSLTAWNL